MSNTNAPAKAAAKPELVEVKLAKNHTHAGEPKVPGNKIKVTGPEREFLVRAGVVEAEGTAPAEQ